MTQFLLALGVDMTMLPASVSVVPAGSDEFLRRAAERIFDAHVLADVVTVLSDGDDFDTILLHTQRDLNDGREYASTEASKLMATLARAAKQFVLWYGDDFDDLEQIEDTLDLTRAVLGGLATSSAEVYLRFSLPDVAKC